MPDASQYRLSRHALPRKYDLEIRPDLDAGTFTGRVVIALDLQPGNGSAVESITLNSADLVVDAASITAGDTSTDCGIELDPSTERLTLTGFSVVPGDAQLSLEFRGVLNDQLRGFYRATFTDADGDERTIATTQFESTDARRAFPCFDEPDMKATFAVTLVIDESHEAVSNAEEVARSNADGFTTITFADTMVMSTYLVAFVIGPLEFTGPVTAGGTDIRIVHPPGQAHLAQYALGVASDSLNFFEDYYGIAYPGDKLDLAAVPDFAFGAMENLGCVIFRESLLLVDPDAVTQPELQRVADVINHELAHMWFGDLVTMRWWNGIWLNEAFATFMEMSATHDQRPDWDRWVFFGTERSRALDTDALRATRPVEFEVRSPEEAEGMFDVLTYQKGAALVRMLEQHLGADAFRKAIGEYLRRHAYANTETGDLWDAIEKSTGEPVRALMDSWIFQEGYPVIDISTAGSEVRLSQRRFLLDGSESSTIWSVPVTWSASADGARQIGKTLLDEADLVTDVGFAPEIVRANIGGHGFFRVMYEPSMLDAIVDHIDELDALERYCLVDDLWAFVRAGQVEAARFVEIAEKFASETDHRVWTALLAGLAGASRLVDDDASKTNLQRRVRELMGPIRADLGDDVRPGDSDLERQLRADLLHAAGTLADDDKAVAVALEVHKRHLSDDAPDAPLLGAAIRVLAAHGDQGRWDEFVKRAADEPTAQARLRYQRALAEFPEGSLIAATVGHALSDAVRSQDAAFVFVQALANRGTHADAWQAIRSRWSDIEAKLPTMLVGRLGAGFAPIDDATVANDVEAFFAEHPIPQAEKTMAQHLEQMRISVATHERESSRLTDWLK